MCALCISDLHGNYAKLKAFVDYKPEIEHCILGDFFDSWHATDDDIASTFRLAIDSNCTLIAGNHELPYLPVMHGYFRCSGNRENPIFKHAMAAYLDKFSAAAVRDGYLLTHGGLSKKHGRPFDNVDDAAEWINSEWYDYISKPVVPESLSPIFDIGSIRGGRQDVGGVFWCSIGHEKLDPRFPQVVGHTPRPEPFKMFVGKGSNIIHACTDCPKYYCFNTASEEFEDFMLEEYKNNDQTRRMLERNF